MSEESEQNGDTRVEIASRFFARVSQTLFRDYLHFSIPVIGLAGLAIVVSGKPDPGTSPRLYEFAKNVSNTVLLAGVVTTFMRFFASFDIVGQRVSGWLNDPRYLSSLSARLADSVHETNRIDALVLRLAEAVYHPQKIRDLGVLD